MVRVLLSEVLMMERQPKKSVSVQVCMIQITYIFTVCQAASYPPCDIWTLNMNQIYCQVKVFTVREIRPGRLVLTVKIKTYEIMNTSRITLNLSYLQCRNMKELWAI